MVASYRTRYYDVQYNANPHNANPLHMLRAVSGRSISYPRTKTRGGHAGRRCSISHMNIHRRSLCAMASLAAAVCVPSALYAQRFQGEIQQMLARDKTNPPPQGGILFIGSSIFRFWTHLSEQMAPLPVFNHAFGGSVTQDILDRADQLVF